MARVIDEEVRALVPDTTITDICAQITTADVMVTDMVSKCTAVFTATVLKEITRWLAAHFVIIADPELQKIKEKVEGTTIELSKGDINKEGLMSTQFGQTANALSSGCLMESVKAAPKVGFC